MKGPIECATRNALDHFPRFARRRTGREPCGRDRPLGFAPNRWLSHGHLRRRESDELLQRHDVGFYRDLITSGKISTPRTSDVTGYADEKGAAALQAATTLRRSRRGRVRGSSGAANGSEGRIVGMEEAGRRRSAVLQLAKQPPARGFSLIELSVVLTIFALLATTSNALLFGPLRDHQFMTFAVLVCGDFQRALSQAQTSYRPIRMNVHPEQDAFYKLEIQIDRGWHTLSLPLKHSRYQGQITMAVKTPLPHPHDPGNLLVQGFRSSHAPYFYFRRRGSSSGTLAFSDPSGRTLCFVLAGDTNRLRAYLWLPSQAQWQALL